MNLIRNFICQSDRKNITYKKYNHSTNCVLIDAEKVIQKAKIFYKNKELTFTLAKFYQAPASNKTLRKTEKPAGKNSLYVIIFYTASFVKSSILITFYEMLLMVLKHANKLG